MQYLNKLLIATLIASGLAACGSTTTTLPAPRSAPCVSLLEPANGTTVASPFKVRFGIQGMAVAPAGDVVAGSGHHHLLINLDAVPAGESLPFTVQHLHFGKGQTEAEVTLTPGRYRLTAQFGNGVHQSYGPAMSQTITVTVK